MKITNTQWVEMVKAEMPGLDEDLYNRLLKELDAASTPEDEEKEVDAKYIHDSIEEMKFWLQTELEERG